MAARLRPTPKAKPRWSPMPRALLARTGAQALEFRHREPQPDSEGWIERPDLYVTFRKPIEADHERNMKAIPRKQRAMVRKGIQNGLTSVAGHDAGTLHAIYAESVRNLGTPVFSRRYFRLLMEVFARRCRCGHGAGRRCRRSPR